MPTSPRFTSACYPPASAVSGTRPSCGIARRCGRC